MLLSLCYFSWFRSSSHSRVNGNIGYEVFIDDANFGMLLVGSLFCKLYTYKSSALQLFDMFSHSTFAILCCK